MQVGSHLTRKAAITAALEEYIQRRKQLEILNLFGTIDFDPSYDYKRNHQMDQVELEA